MARGASSFAKEEALAGGDVAFRLDVERGRVHAADEDCQCAQLIFGEREGRHSAGGALLNDVVDFGYGAGAETAAARECGGAVGAGCVGGMAGCAALLVQLRGVGSGRWGLGEGKSDEGG